MLARAEVLQFAGRPHDAATAQIAPIPTHPRMSPKHLTNRARDRSMLPPMGKIVIVGGGMVAGYAAKEFVERGGKKVFIHKEEILEATTERIATLKKFKGDLRDILQNDKNTGG